MNLKEAFRYQKFLDTMMYQARRSLNNEEHTLKTTKNHLRSKANADAEDITEEVVPVTPFFPNDEVIRFMEWLVTEREHLSNAISAAKEKAPIDIDAAIDTNKFRQAVYGSIREMLSYHKSKSMSQGRDYRFDVNGVQAPYYYDIEIIKEEAFDRDKSRDAMRRMITKADEVSAEIDAVMINTQVEYSPWFDVNESFDDVMTAFTAVI